LTQENEVVGSGFVDDPMEGVRLRKVFFCEGRTRRFRWRNDAVAVRFLSNLMFSRKEARSTDDNNSYQRSLSFIRSVLEWSEQNQEDTMRQKDEANEKRISKHRAWQNAKASGDMSVTGVDRISVSTEGKNSFASKCIEKKEKQKETMASEKLLMGVEDDEFSFFVNLSMWWPLL
jgi:hypothetical protein